MEPRLTPSIAMDRDLMDRLDAEARSQKRDRSYIVREACEQYLHIEESKRAKRKSA